MLFHDISSLEGDTTSCYVLVNTSLIRVGVLVGLNDAVERMR